MFCNQNLKFKLAYLYYCANTALNNVNHLIKLYLNTKSLLNVLK